MKQNVVTNDCIEYIKKYANSETTLNELVDGIDKDLGVKLGSHHIIYYIDKFKLEFKKHNRPQQVIYAHRFDLNVAYFDRAYISSINKLQRVFNLKKGGRYQIVTLPDTMVGDEHIRNTEDSTSSVLEYLYCTKYFLVFRNRIGFIETFPRHRGLIQIYKIKGE